jgi:hypothetical protein
VGGRAWSVGSKEVMPRWCQRTKTQEMAQTLTGSAPSLAGTTSVVAINSPGLLVPFFCCCLKAIDSFADLHIQVHEGMAAQGGRVPTDYNLRNL